MAKKAEASLLVKIKEQGRKSLDAIREGFDKIKTSVVVAGAAIAATLTASLVKYRAQEKAVNSLNASLNAQGLDVQRLSKNYQEWASAIQKKTTFGDEEILQAVSFGQTLLGNTELTEELIGLTADLAAAEGIDLKGAFKTVGQSIGTTSNALAAYGIELDTNATKQEKLAAVTEQMRSRFGGMAEAQAKGLGSITQLTNSFGDFLEKIGEEVAPVVSDFATQLTGFFDTIQEDVSKFGIRELAEDVADFVSSSVENLISFGRSLNEVFGFAIGDFISFGKAQREAFEPSLPTRFFRGVSIALSETQFFIDKLIVGFAQIKNNIVGTAQAAIAAAKLDFSKAQDILIATEKKNSRLQADILKDRAQRRGEIDKNYFDQQIREQERQFSRIEELEKFSVEKIEVQRIKAVRSRNQKVLQDNKKTSEKTTEIVEDEAKKQADIFRKEWQDTADKIQIFIKDGFKGIGQKSVEAITLDFLPGFENAASEAFNLLTLEADEFEKRLQAMFSLKFVENIAENVGTFFGEVGKGLAGFSEFLFGKQGAGAVTPPPTGLETPLGSGALGQGGLGGLGRIGDTALEGTIVQLKSKTAEQEFVERLGRLGDPGQLAGLGRLSLREAGAAPTINLTVNGGLLGDQQSARQLAKALDAEITKLRQGSEARSFDTGIF